MKSTAAAAPEDVTGSVVSAYSPFLALLDRGVRSALESKLQPRTIGRGQFLIFRGDPSAVVYFIRSGGVLLLCSTQGGTENAFGWVGPGGACGLEEAICDRPYAFSARATTDTTASRLLTTDLLAFFRNDPSVVLAAARYLAVRVGLLCEHLELIAQETLVTRVRKVLKLLAPSDDSEPFPLPLTQTDLAALVSASRQRVNKILIDLRRDGIIHSRGRKILLNNTPNL
jgi:CRP-like cAMP-binding protein